MVFADDFTEDDRNFDVRGLKLLNMLRGVDFEDATTGTGIVGSSECLSSGITSLLDTQVFCLTKSP